MDDVCNACNGMNVEWVVDKMVLKSVCGFKIITQPTNLLKVCEDCGEEELVYISYGIIMI